ncbi:hypothetical protein H17ap60334_00612 [Thermosipho africanus H17ap60334]|jgi:predicted transcriptional regulator|uniref:Uncharacterized protein n=1 Tax=Thermosipho africanus (strain TCF52B) TaxID=484019 RepID=B7IG64_THEAB|nr:MULTISPECIES: hypothetical protein [Thermosipho]HCF37729.1 hypothetical protein [Thermosipho africanus]ACJ75078.1 conserved hypothetical protein [Thermosipho africanus TCF52B]EKF50194.1 hypothetical protein H17ap60334_00612 [Thermosipho africanus H17ap60334]MBZ4649970.1 hypothetical protein [Thermosipho sp. (in: thermotogales)]MDK2838790.1 hypothetical protein [Thermosipho sp. (in: thermotogales)]
MENNTLEELVRRYLKVKETIKELNREKKELEEMIVEFVEHMDIDNIIVDGVMVEFARKTKIQIK